MKELTPERKRQKLYSIYGDLLAFSAKALARNFNREELDEMRREIERCLGSGDPKAEADAMRTIDRIGQAIQERSE